MGDDPVRMHGALAAPVAGARVRDRDRTTVTRPFGNGQQNVGSLSGHGLAPEGELGRVRQDFQPACERFSSS